MFSDELMSHVGPDEMRRLVRAADHYEGYGYRHIDTPWAVQQKVSHATKPPQSWPVHHHVRALNHTFHLVASGEQSFLQMQYERLKFKEAPPLEGRYQTITPCFRDEAAHSRTYRFGFMKLELIEWLTLDIEVTEAATKCVSMLNHARQLFASGGLGGTEVIVVPTTEGFDLEIDNIEVGSYGVRERVIGGVTLRWVYGTGWAEPRMAVAKQYSKSVNRCCE